MLRHLSASSLVSTGKSSRDMSVLEKFEDGTRQRASDNTATNSEASMNQKRREFINFVLYTLNKNYPWFLYPYFVFLWHQHHLVF